MATTVSKPYVSAEMVAAGAASDAVQQIVSIQGRSGATSDCEVELRAELTDREIRLHLTATLPRPPGVEAQRGKVAVYASQRRFQEAAALARDILAECLRPALGGPR